MTHGPISFVLDLVLIGSALWGLRLIGQGARELWRKQ